MAVVRERDDVAEVERLAKIGKSRAAPRGNEVKGKVGADIEWRRGLGDLSAHFRYT